MYTDMENWAEIRRRVLVDGLSKRAACREYDLHWDTLTKILDHPEPPGYRRTAPRPRPKLDPLLPVIDQILEADRKAPRKQRHTARRIFERLRDEHGYTGGRDRKLTDAFLRLKSHNLFESHFCRVRRPNEKGHVETLVGFARRNFLVPVPVLHDGLDGEL